MDTNELKFLLKLLGCPNYRSSLSASSFKSITGKEKLCRDLGDRNLVDFSREIASVKILPAGRALLKMSTEQLPITDKELKVLEKISKSSGKIAPSKISVSSVKAAEREAILESLGERGLIEVEKKLKKAKAEVWLTERGQEYLRDEYTAKGSNPVISLDLLTNYLRFLRKSPHVRDVHQEPLQTPTAVAVTSKLSDEEILQTIRHLDGELGTGNYLPIFHLRQKLEPPLSREDLDQALYRLEGSDQIELSALVEATRYSQEQVNAGIKQRSGSPLFFIKVTVN
jgi:predicted transcriptional regulator